MTADPDFALEIARQLADAGVPVFIAYPHPAHTGEYKPPPNWQKTQPNRAYVDAWKPGLALCAVMGCGIDLIDIDPRNGGDIVQLFRTTSLPDIIGSATTPSGGQHLFITSMNVGSRDGIMPGIDIKAGDSDGNGRGFAYIAPTIRVSKTTGELAPYKWADKPDPSRINGYRDTTSALADLVRRTRQTTRQTLFTDPAPLERKHAGPIPYGEHHPRLVAYAGWLRSLGLPLQPEAETLMRRRMLDLVQPAEATRPKYTEDEALAELRDVYQRYAAGATAELTPDLPAAEFTAVDWAEAFSSAPDHIDWLLEPLLERGTLNVLYGAPGVGKSLITLEITARLAKDGHRILYVDHENRISDIVERLRDMAYTPADLANLRFYSFPSLPALDTLPGGIKLSDLAEAESATLVVIDTTMRLVAGKENDSDTINNLYRYSLVPLKARNITVLRLDHPGKDETRGQRGSSAKLGDVDTVWRLSGRDRSFRLDREKTRSNHGLDVVLLTQLIEPLRHEWAIGGPPLATDKVADAIELADRLGVPDSAGRPTLERELRAAGLEAGNAVLSRVAEIRKARPPVPDSAGQVGTAQLSAVPTPRWGQRDSAQFRQPE